MGGFPFGFRWPYFPNVRLGWPEKGIYRVGRGPFLEKWAISTVTMKGQTKRLQVLCPSSCHPMCMAPCGTAGAPVGTEAVGSPGDFADGFRYRMLR